MHSSSLPRRFALLAAAVALTIPLIGPRAALADDDDMANVGVARVSLISGSVAVQRGDATSPSAAVDQRARPGRRLSDDRRRFTRRGGNRRRHRRSPRRRRADALHASRERCARDPAGGRHDRTAAAARHRRFVEHRYAVDLRPAARRRELSRQRYPRWSNARHRTLGRRGDHRSARRAVADSRHDARRAGPGFRAFDRQPSGDRGRRFRSVQRRARRQLSSRRSDRIATSTPTSPALPIWPPTATGLPIPATARSGRRPTSRPTGRPTVTAAGSGKRISAGPGSAPKPGAGLPIITARGTTARPTAGPGIRRGPDRSFRSGVRLWSASSPSAAAVGIGYAGGGLGVNIGWVPLAPYEPYHPWWGNRWGGGVNVYISNEAFVHTYRNAQYGVTAVPGRRFTSGSFGHPMVVAAAQLHDVQAIRGALPVVPTQANLRFSNAHVAPGLAVRGSFAAHAFAGSGAPVQRVPFEQQRAAYASAAHLPLSSPARQGSAYGSAGGAYHADGAPARSSGDAWTRFGENRALEGTHGTNSAPSYAGAGPATSRATPAEPATLRATAAVRATSRPTVAARATFRPPPARAPEGSPTADTATAPPGPGRRARTALRRVATARRRGRIALRRGAPPCGRTGPPREAAAPRTPCTRVRTATIARAEDASGLTRSRTAAVSSTAAVSLARVPSGGVCFTVVRQTAKGSRHSYDIRPMDRLGKRGSSRPPGQRRADGRALLGLSDVGRLGRHRRGRTRHERIDGRDLVR
jgi:hypothetical protein